MNSNGTAFDWTSIRAALSITRDDQYNIGWHCADRLCLQGKAQQPALVWQDLHGTVRSFTFDHVRTGSNTMAALLQRLGVSPGDRVALVLDRIPDCYLAFLAILKTGAIVQPLFAAFGDDALRVRLADAGTTVVVTQRKYLLKVRRVASTLAALKTVVVVDAGSTDELLSSEIAFSALAAPQVESFAVYPATPATPSILHYTSGTTATPKGVLHVHNALLAHYLTAKLVLDLRETDVYWCTADPGWVTGTSYGIIGPWSLGITQCVLDCGFSARAWYAFIERHRISVWYSAPTAIRSLMSAGDMLPHSFDLSSLRHLASVGEPLNAEAVLWSQRIFGIPFHDTYWQTETGAIMVANVPGTPVKPGSMGRPLPWVDAVILDPESYTPRAASDASGLLGFRPGWPSMMSGYWHNDAAHARKIVNGWFITGDQARADADGYIWFIGRDDDIINTAGHLLSPFEVESALLEHPAVAESAVVSMPDPVNMEVVKAFVVLAPGNTPGDDLTLALTNHVRRRVASFAMPRVIEYVNTLPRTRSGKILRRLLRAQAWGIATDADTTAHEQQSENPDTADSTP